MDNMHWDEATQTWSGHAEPWLMNQEPAHYNGWNKPLLVPNEWLTPVAAQPLHNVWLDLQRQALGVGGQDLVIYPMKETPQDMQGALHQLVQAMAAFAPPGAMQQQEPGGQSVQQQMLLWVADSSRWA